MREIKYRAVYKNKVYQVHSIEFYLDGTYSVLLRIDKDVTYPDQSDISVIIEFTGLQDKTGQDVYEGDILLDYHNTKWQIVNGLNQKEIVSHNSSQTKSRFLGSGFYQKEIGQDVNAYHILTCCNFGKIIGNIYENPELLAQGRGKNNN